MKLQAFPLDPHDKHSFQMPGIAGRAHGTDQDTLICAVDEQILSTTPDFHHYGSITRQAAPVDIGEFLAELGDKTHIMWTRRRDT